MYKITDIARTPNKLAEHYKKFRVTEKILLTGHSHQAWPDAAFEAQMQAYNDAADRADDKWEIAFQKAEDVRKGFSELMNDGSGYISLAPNTHEMVVRLISALDLKNKRKIITSDSEFYSVRRQVDRLAEDGIENVKISVNPVETFVERVIDAIDEKTMAVMISKVFFNTGRIGPNYAEIEKKCIEKGAVLLVDVYHALNVAPFDIKKEGLEKSFIVGGGYKYCQFGEGNCFLRFPKDCKMRPMNTGWFSEFGTLSNGKKEGEVLYGEGSLLFAGSTYDPVSHYRAARVLEFFNEQKLSPEFLREISQHQIGVLIKEFDKAGFDEKVIRRDKSISLKDTAGFLVFYTEHSARISAELRKENIITDFRGNNLRFGPAPYLSDEQLKEAIETMEKIIRHLD